MLVDAFVPPTQLQRQAGAPGKGQAFGLTGSEKLTLDADGQTIWGRARCGRGPARDSGDGGQQGRADGDISSTVRQSINELQRGGALG